MRSQEKIHSESTSCTAPAGSSGICIPPLLDGGGISLWFLRQVDARSARSAPDVRTNQ